MELQNTDEQALDLETSDETINQPTYNINGIEMTADKLAESYKNLQSDYTKKSQKLSEYEKQKETIDFTAKETEIKKVESEFNDFKSTFTVLSETQCKAIRDLKAINPNKSYEDIAKDYGMLQEAQIVKAKSVKWVIWGTFALPDNKTEKIELSDYAKKMLKITPNQNKDDFLSMCWLK